MTFFNTYDAPHQVDEQPDADDGVKSDAGMYKIEAEARAVDMRRFA